MNDLIQYLAERLRTAVLRLAKWLYAGLTTSAHSIHSPDIHDVYGGEDNLRTPDSRLPHWEDLLLTADLIASLTPDEFTVYAAEELTP